MRVPHYNECVFGFNSMSHVTTLSICVPLWGLLTTVRIQKVTQTVLVLLFDYAKLSNKTNFLLNVK